MGPTTYYKSGEQFLQIHITEKNDVKMEHMYSI